jgi:hypothetical protein
MIYIIFGLILIFKKRLKIYSEHSVPPFGPSLPVPPIFTNHKEFREFLLVKCIKKFKFKLFKYSLIIVLIYCLSNKW